MEAERVACHDGVAKFAPREEPRARQSECVNMNAVRLHAQLQQLHLVPSISAAPLTSLPSEVVDALLSQVTQFAEEQEASADALAALEARRQRAAEETEQCSEKTERVLSTVAYLSDKSSAELQDFRAQLQQSAHWTKEHNRALLDITRQQEKLDFETRRTQMEIARLRRIAKHVK